MSLMVNLHEAEKVVAVFPPRIFRHTLDRWLSIIFSCIVIGCCSPFQYNFLEMFHNKNKYRNVNIVMSSAQSIIPFGFIVISF